MLDTSVGCEVSILYEPHIMNVNVNVLIIKWVGKHGHERINKVCGNTSILYDVDEYFSV